MLVHSTLLVANDANSKADARSNYTRMFRIMLLILSKAAAKSDVILSICVDAFSRTEMRSHREIPSRTRIFLEQALFTSCYLSAPAEKIFRTKKSFHSFPSTWIAKVPCKGAAWITTCLPLKRSEQVNKCLANSPLSQKWLNLIVSEREKRGNQISLS